jgi:hypothetical protein
MGMSILTPMIKLLLSFVLLFTFFQIQAQTDNTKIQPAPPDTANTGPWNRGGAGTINFSQVSLSNWAAGGQNSVSVLAISNLFANYKHGNNTWNNTFDLTYGLLKTGKSRMQKSDDRLDVTAKYGHNASTNWYYTGQLKFQSQLTPTYNQQGDTLISRFLAPAFVLASVGMDYKPNDNFSVFLSPVTGKFTIVRNQQLADEGAFGVEPARRVDDIPVPGTGQNFRKEFGAYTSVKLRKPVMENITFQTKLDLFSNYLEKPQNIDVNWETLLDLKVNKLLSVSVFAHLIYDDDINIKVDTNNDGVTDSIGPRVQFKETLGVGITYNFR